MGGAVRVCKMFALHGVFQIRNLGHEMYEMCCFRFHGSQMMCCFRV